jgi:hypothetical protein
MERVIGDGTAVPVTAEEIRSAVRSLFGEEHRVLREMDAYAGIFADRAYGLREAERALGPQLSEIRARRAELLRRLQEAEGAEVRAARERLGLAVAGTGEETRPGTPKREAPAVF